MKLIQTLLVLAVFAFAMTGCKKKTVKVAETLCACYSDLQAHADEMRAAAGDEEKLKELARRHAEVNTKAVDCIKTNMTKYSEDFKSEDFKAGMLNEMKSRCPKVAALFSRFVNYKGIPQSKE